MGSEERKKENPTHGIWTGGSFCTQQRKKSVSLKFYTLIFLNIQFLNVVFTEPTMRYKGVAFLLCLKWKTKTGFKSVSYNAGFSLLWSSNQQCLQLPIKHSAVAASQPLGGDIYHHSHLQMQIERGTREEAWRRERNGTMEERSEKGGTQAGDKDDREGLREERTAIESDWMNSVEH